MTNNSPAMPSARALALRAKPLRVLSLCAAITIAGCERPSPAKVAEQMAEQNYQGNYQNCINRVTGVFSSASVEVMRECRQLAEKGRDA